MKYLSLFIILILSTISASIMNAQVTNLIPSWKSIPEAPSSMSPDYGALLETITNEILKWSNINCMRSINNQLESKVASARVKARQKTNYFAIIDYTDIRNCQVTSFEPQNGNLTPSVMHDPNTKVLIYMIEINPYILINGKYY